VEQLKRRITESRDNLDVQLFDEILEDVQQRIQFIYREFCWHVCAQSKADELQVQLEDEKFTSTSLDFGDFRPFFEACITILTWRKKKSRNVSRQIAHLIVANFSLFIEWVPILHLEHVMAFIKSEITTPTMYDALYEYVKRPVLLCMIDAKKDNKHIF